MGKGKFYGKAKISEENGVYMSNFQERQGGGERGEGRETCKS